VDKSKVFEVFYGTLKTAPMIRECPVTMECRLVQAMDLPTNTLFIGEIVGSYTDEEVWNDGKPDFRSINPLLLAMPDNIYWTLGEAVGKAWRAGAGLKQM
jgi:flavin reductase (DIM6/NTAB) family NADH-FMN oxidoreductase RutF